MNGYVKYNSNNSGGRWWLTDADWRALEAAGWRVAWNVRVPVYTPDGKRKERNDDGTPLLVPRDDPRANVQPWDRISEDGRWLGALATYAYRAGLSLRDAVQEWERVTGKSAIDAGCPCCGQPHMFTQYDADGEYVTSGPDTEYFASWDEA